ncbi:putative surfeit locus protein 6 [Sciurus carolinensis]|uniref:Surfeit locus protein 6 n=1 Tax=Sciurus carolinensis TaxID=30640 RepID=A0AA41MK55_SCICA|nr:putative surfeit locus protein 6 [Sciurus carolinensis]
MGSKDKSLGEKSPMTSGEMKSAINKGKETAGGMADVSSLCPGGPATVLQEKTQQTRDQGRSKILFTVLLDKRQWIKHEWDHKGPRGGREGNKEKGVSKASLEVACMEPWELALIFIKLEVCEEAPATKVHCRKEAAEDEGDLHASDSQELTAVARVPAGTARSTGNGTQGAGCRVGPQP